MSTAAAVPKDAALIPPTPAAPHPAPDSPATGAAALLADPSGTVTAAPPEPDSAAEDCSSKQRGGNHQEAEDGLPAPVFDRPASQANAFAPARLTPCRQRPHWAMTTV